VPPLPPGLVHVLLHGPGILPIARDVELASGACWLDFAAEPAESVAARFDYQQADNPFTVNGPLRVQVFDRGGALVLEDYVRAATAPGRFDFATGLPAGDYRVRATALWNGIADCDLPVRNGATAPVVATLRL